MGNAVEYEAYVARRTEDLLRMGAVKDRSQAQTQATWDAERRYGARTGAHRATWSIGNASHPLKMSEIDQALAKARDAR